MNGTYYQNPTFPTAATNNYTDTIVPVGTELTMEQSYIENILRLNKGKKVKAYVSYPDSLDWKDSIYNGIIEQAGRDHLIISNCLECTYSEVKDNIFDHKFIISEIKI